MTEANASNDLAQLLAEMAVLREKMAAQEAELGDLRAKVHSLESDNAVVSSGQRSLGRVSTSRRNLLKLGGAVAGAALLGSLGAAAKSEIVLADKDGLVKLPLPLSDPLNDKPTSIKPSTDGGNMLIAVANFPTSTTSSTTRMVNPSTSQLVPNLFRSNNYSNSSLGLPANSKIALAATTSGVDSDANQTKIGLFAGIDGPGTSGYGYAIYADGGSSNAICGVSNGTSGIGVYGYSSQYYGGYFYGDRAGMALGPSGAAPWTRSDTHNVGELYVDSSGDLWYCAATGTPGTWRKLAGSGTAGSTHLMNPPSRFVDTRTGTGRIGSGSPLSHNTPVTYTLAGATGSGGAVLPSNAKGVIGNVTVVVPSNSGVVLLGPTALNPASSPSTLNFPAGAIIANGFSSSLDSLGRLVVSISFAGGVGSSNVLIDITGYYL
jgi:hypothetical protein